MDKIIQRFYDIATVKWSLSRSIEGKEILYNPDTVYYGMPFSRRNWMPFDKFLEMRKNGVYQLTDSMEKIPGINCAGSIMWALKDVVSFPSYYETLGIMCDRELTVPLGCFKFDESDLYFNQAGLFSSSDFVMESYGELRVGDIIGRYFKKRADGGWFGHLRLITGNTFVYSKDNRIDPDLSYVVSSENNVYLSDIENSNNFGCMVRDDETVEFGCNPDYTDIKDFRELKGKYTHFMVNKKHSFADLLKEYYIPLRFRVFT